MSHGKRSWLGVMLIALLVVAGFGKQSGADEDPRTALQFLEQLRGRGFYDLSEQVIETLRKQSNLPDDIKVILDYLEAKGELEEAARSNDLVRRRELLEDARAKLEEFVKAHPDHPMSREAIVQIARMLVERGHVFLQMAEEVGTEAQKASRIADARGSITQAREAYGRAVEQLNQIHKGFPGFIPRDDPRAEERDRVYVALLDSTLQQAVADYELAQTYPEGSGERTKFLTDALKQFETINNNHRTEMAGLTAQMWQAKCFEEQGKLGEAIGIYKTLLRETDPRLRSLQFFVGYFHIVALAKRKDYALAADEATRWLEKFNRPEEQRSPEGLGVLLQLAKNIDAQMDGVADKNEKQQAAKRIIDVTSQVVKYASSHKKEALALLKKYKPTAAAKAEELSRLTYEDAMTQAEEAISTTEWDRAIALVQAALAKVDPRKEPEKANRARYYLAFCYYSTKQFYEANVLAEHLARRYPENGLSPKATEIGMQALADAYMTYAEIDRTADLERLIDLAKYTAEAWPDREQGDDAHLNLGQIYQGRGQYDEAFKEFAAVRDRSSKKIEAETRLGGAHWAKSRALDRNGEKDQAAAEAAQAIEILNKTLKTRQDAGTGATDPGLIGNAADLATAQTETGHADQALELLKPILEAQTAKSGPLYARLIEANLLAQIHSGQVENAIASMKSLEQSGPSGGRGRLYVELGKLLEKEMSRLRESKNTTALASTQQTYRSFLNAFRESQTEQNYDSLQWAGESLLTIDAGDDAAKALQAALDLAINDPAFQSRPDAKDKILRSKVKLAHAFRIDGKLDRAASLVEEALSQYPRNLEPRMEKGMLLEAQAKAGQAEWGAVFRYWQDLAQKLARNPKPAAYYEAWYQAAGALAQQKETAKARQTLTAIMRLNPTVGGPEMKAKYQKFLDTLK